MLAPAVGLPVPDDVVALLLPVAAGRVVRRTLVKRHRPQLEVDRLTRLQVLVRADQRHAAAWRAVVLAVGHDRVVLVENGSGLLLAVGQLKLVRDPIGLDVDTTARAPVIVIQHRGPAELRSASQSR